MIRCHHCLAPDEGDEEDEDAADNWRTDFVIDLKVIVNEPPQEDMLLRRSKAIGGFFLWTLLVVSAISVLFFLL